MTEKVRLNMYGVWVCLGYARIRLWKTIFRELDSPFSF